MKHLLAVIGLMSLAAAAEARCTESREIERNIDAAGLSSLDLIARAGSLRIEAGNGSAVHLRARLCSSEAKALDRMDVSQDTVDGRLSLEAVIPWDTPGFDPESAYIDLELRVPAALAIDAMDSSGDIVARGVSLRSLRDSSGGIRIEDGRSGLRLEDSSGDIEIDGLAGDLELRDSSGDIEVEAVAGGVHVRVDSSGDIRLRDVGGPVRIDQDSSGGILVEQVRGGVHIGSDSSGSIEVRDVSGDVSVGSDGSGEIAVRDVRGNFSVREKGRGPISAHGVTGEVSLP